MRRSAVVIFVLVMAVLVLPTAAWAGNPHFVGEPTIRIVGNTLTVSGKEAGLGNEDQIHVVLVAEASCINRGEKNPSAANKDSFSAAGDFPVQNGKANFTLTVTAVFSPSCSPPMRVDFTRVTLTDETNNLTKTFIV
jgi:hypothetical protein